MNAQPDTVRIALLGAAGRMGRAVLGAALDYPGVRIGAVIVRAGHIPDDPLPEGLAYTDNLKQALAASDVLLDFSAPPSTAAAVDVCVAAGKPLVTGVTGLDENIHAKLIAAGKSIAVLAAPNMSPGANLLLTLTRIAAAALGPEFDIEITDIHHSGKKDAPSGTALALGQAAANARGLTLENCAEFGRGPDRSPRQPGSIGFASLRAGDLAGEHRVLFGGPAESLELMHRAASRAAFAFGALAATRWIANRPAGLYSMAEVLNLPGAAR